MPMIHREIHISKAAEIAKVNKTQKQSSIDKKTAFLKERTLDTSPVADKALQAFSELSRENNAPNALPKSNDVTLYNQYDSVNTKNNLQVFNLIEFYIPNLYKFYGRFTVKKIICQAFIIYWVKRPTTILDIFKIFIR